MAKAKKKAAKKKVAKKTTKKAAGKKTTKKAAAKKSALLKKPAAGGKSYTKSQMLAHLAEATSNHGYGEISKKQAAAFMEELGNLLIKYAPVGATVPGIGKLVLRRTKARIGRNPQTGEPIKIPARKKLAFRVSKQAKVAAGIA